MEGQAAQGDNVQVAIGQGDTAQPAPAQSDTAPVAPEQDDKSQLVTEPQNQDDKGPVPYERFSEMNQKFKAESDARAQAEARAAQVEQLLTQMRWQQMQQVQTQPQQPQADPIQEFMKRENIGSEGIITPEDLAKTVAFVREHSRREQYEHSLRTEREQWFASHPDYVGTVVTPTGQYSEYLQKAIQRNPALGVSLQRTPDPVLAYEIAMSEKNRAKADTPSPSSGMSQPALPMPQTNAAQQIRAAQAAPQSVATVQGGGQMDRRTMIANMSDEEFAKYYDDVKNGRVHTPAG